VTATNQKCLWPGYVYPSIWDDTTAWLSWGRLAQPGQSREGSVAVMNPSSGPGTAVVSDYTGAVNHGRNCGHRVIGYTHTSYAARAIADVEAEIDDYYAWYDVDGIFVDEMSNASTDSAYYHSLWTYIGAKPGKHLTVGNPGAAAATDWQVKAGSTQACDIVCMFEDTAANYLAWSPPSWTSGYPADTFAHLVHTCASANLAAVIARSQGKAGYRYVTDQALPNPWGTLAYWPAQATP
jgi:Spherulation-specific family 4